MTRQWKLETVCNFKSRLFATFCSCQLDFKVSSIFKIRTKIHYYLQILFKYFIFRLAWLDFLFTSLCSAHPGAYTLFVKVIKVPFTRHEIKSVPKPDCQSNYVPKLMTKSVLLQKKIPILELIMKFMILFLHFGTDFAFQFGTGFITLFLLRTLRLTAIRR